MRLIDVLLARRRIAPYVRRTPLCARRGCPTCRAPTCALKLESLQLSHSFKWRGRIQRRHRAARARHAEARRALVTASAGNHGRALAAAAETFSLPLSCSRRPTRRQVQARRDPRHGADLRADSRDYDEAERMAKAFASETGAEFISPYSDADVIAGAATAALEIFEDAADTDLLVVPIGGGGLISGAAAVAKAVSTRCAVVGVEVEVSCAFQTSVRAGKLVEIVPGASLADGLGGNPDPETITFEPIQRLVDQLVTVSEEIWKTRSSGWSTADHVIAEGAGAAATGGARREARSTSQDAAWRSFVSGANIDRARLAALLA